MERRVVAVILQIMAVCLINICCFYDNAVLSADVPGDMRYGIVVDAGSSGSRAKLFVSTPRTSKDTLPSFDEIFSTKVEPGISSFKSDLEGLKPYLEQLIDKVKIEVPVEKHAETSIYLMATAGMRLLLEPRANAIMEEIQSVLSDPELCPFQFHEYQARILSGEEEGVFAWIASNYLNGYFDDPAQRTTAGILELGGGSTQIAFIPDGSILADKFPVRLAGITYPLYVHSYLYYGQNSADQWIKEYLQRENTQNLNVLSNPCMLRGDTQTNNISNVMLTFHGSGQPHECAEIVRKLVYKVPPYKCYPKPCGVGAVYQPSIGDEKLFFALSAFTYALRTLQVVGNEGGVFSPEDTFTAALTFCQRNINEIMQDLNKTAEFLSVECLMGLYIPILFTSGYGFANDSRQVDAKFTINGQPAEWPLGAIIYETERKASGLCSGLTQPHTMGVTYKNNGGSSRFIHRNTNNVICFIFIWYLKYHHFFWS